MTAILIPANFGRSSFSRDECWIVEAYDITGRTTAQCIFRALTNVRSHAEMAISADFDISPKCAFHFGFVSTWTPRILISAFELICL